MQIDNRMRDIKNKIDSELKIYFEQKIDKVRNEGNQKDVLQAVENLKSFILSSGKRIRPILFYFGYIIAGGKNMKSVLNVSISMELMHSYLLIHDDIIDRDDFRHGIYSMHQTYAREYREKYGSKDSKHFGISMAILVGDLASTFGYDVLLKSTFPSDIKLKVISKFNNIVSNTIIGETLDVTLVRCVNASEKQIIEMQRYKTAKYTIEGPLHLGAILAGADDQLLREISEFAIPMGIAFQIKDDIIGIFGKRKKIGKPSGSDLKEGKKTLLISKALEKANIEDREFLINVVGNEDINLETIEKVRDIIVSTGSLKYSEEKAKELILEAREKISLLNISDENKEFLLDLADFIVNRDS